MNLGFNRLTQTFVERWGIECQGLVDAEALATMREAMLLPLDLAPIVPEARAGDDVVVLVHGFLATAGVFRPMRAQLQERTGAKVATFTHAPGSSVKRIASQLKQIVDRLHPHARVHIVGHSLGGIVARWYVQELDGHARVAQTISLASPFGGTRLATHVPSFVGLDLHDRSSALARLRERARHWDVPHTSIVAGADRLVTPAASGAFAVGDVVVLDGRGHNMLLFDDEVVRLIARRLEGARLRAA